MTLGHFNAMAVRTIHQDAGHGSTTFSATLCNFAATAAAFGLFFQGHFQKDVATGGDGMCFAVQVVHPPFGTLPGFFGFGFSGGCFVRGCLGSIDFGLNLFSGFRRGFMNGGSLGQ